MKELIKHFIKRIVCAVTSHNWGETIREDTVAPWKCELIQHVNGDLQTVYKRDFFAYRTCRRCYKTENLVGYDTKPHECDPMNKTQKHYDVIFNSPPHG